MAEGSGPVITPEIRFLKRCFLDYYRNNRIDLPERFARREWGFFPFGGRMMFRHIGFTRRNDVFDFFRDQAPMHSYNSVAYYGDPSLQPMGEKFKTWLGADLIFDLDSDHLPDADKMTFEEQLDAVKIEVKSLLHDFILDDLGISEEYTHLNFSGGRGYHIHVRDPDLMRLGSRERRAIVDYITGRGLNLDVIAPERVVDVNLMFGSEKRRRTFPKREQGGWGRKIQVGKDRLLRELVPLERKDQVKYLLGISKKSDLGIGNAMCSSIVDNLFWKSGGRSSERLLETDLFDVFPRPQQLKDFVKLVVAFTSVNLAGETDEPVTTDIKRLIRVSGSLHGKTGLKVVDVDRDRIEDFDPLRDAVALPDTDVLVTLQDPASIRMMDQEYRLDPGDHRLPLYVAYFLIARKMAKLPDIIS